jgi:glycyl-tRNA synthetase beta chain
MQFLLECFSEEIPSRMQQGAREQLARLFAQHLEKNGLAHGALHTFVSPRHLAILVQDLPAKQPDISEEKKGPKLGAPDAAIQGFLKSTGLSLDQCEVRMVGNDQVYFAVQHKKGRATAEVMKDIAEAVLRDFTWPKSMRWGAHSLRWVRPLHRIVALLDDNIIPVQFGHITASNITHGHRFLSPGAITIAHANAYVEALKAAHVLVDSDARQVAVAKHVHALAAQYDLQLVEDDALLREVTGLVEAPTALLGTLEESFLHLPREVLISEMKYHQRYFALQHKNTALSAHFIAVANMPCETTAAQVIAGNERVLRARLFDGQFYYAQDQKKSLADWNEGLKDVVFHAKVGMMSAKVARIEALAVTLAGAVGYSQDIALVREAARLCKADLTTGMVGEFPELQGIMGRYYARAQGVHDVVAEAIYEHYKPAGAGDSLPETEVGAIISIADKLDSIISLWAAGEKPTGSKDPLALRRAALGIVRIILARGWNLDLTSFIADVEIIAFFQDRLKHAMKEDGFRPDVIEAVMAGTVSQTKKNFLLDRRHVESISAWLATPHGTSYIAALKRVYNLLAAEEKKAKQVFAYDAALVETLTLDVERRLVDELHRLFHYNRHNLNSIVDSQGNLDQKIEAFFEGVLVTDPNFREARLSLLAGIREATNYIADISKLEG